MTPLDRLLFGVTRAFQKRIAREMGLPLGSAVARGERRRKQGVHRPNPQPVPVKIDAIEMVKVEGKWVTP